MVTDRTAIKASSSGMLSWFNRRASEVAQRTSTARSDLRATDSITSRSSPAKTASSTTHQSKPASKVLARDIVRDFGNAYLKVSRMCPTYCTLCSCSEITTLALQALVGQYQQCGIDHIFECVYLRELEEDRRKWKIGLLDSVGKTQCGKDGLIVCNACVFKDLTSCGKDVANVSATSRSAECRHLKESAWESVVKTLHAPIQNAGF